MLMAHRGRPGDGEAEPVVVEVIGSRALLVLDDGEQIELDLGELRAVLDAEEAWGAKAGTYQSP
jgi:hypothetical protein